MVIVCVLIAVSSSGSRSIDALAMLISIISIMAFEIFNYMLMTLAWARTYHDDNGGQPDTFDIS